MSSKGYGSGRDAKRQGAGYKRKFNRPGGKKHGIRMARAKNSRTNSARS